MAALNAGANSARAVVSNPGLVSGVGGIDFACAERVCDVTEASHSKTGFRNFFGWFGAFPEPPATSFPPSPPQPFAPMRYWKQKY